MDFNELIKGYVKKVQDAPNRAVLMKEGQKSNMVFVILKGKAKVQKKTRKGLVTVDILSAGAIVGEMVLLVPELAAGTATIVADGPLKVGILDMKKLEREIAAMSMPLREVIRAVIFQLRDTTQDLGEAAAERA